MARIAGPGRDDYAKDLERLLDGGTAVGASESQLLDRFVQRRDEAAFTALVDRHGSLVMGVCRRYLRDPNDADDAFQAVFLVLARRAGSLRNKALLANWLFGVSCRVAARTRILSVRRREQAAVDDGERLEVDARRPTGLHPAEALARDEESAHLHEEVRRLPDRYRAPVVACYFEGRTHEEAARLLGCPVGTVKGRLSRARDLLRARLERRGLTTPAVALATSLASPDLRAAVPPTLAARAIANAFAAASSAAWMTTPAIPTSVRILSQGVIQTMLITHAKSLAVSATIAAAGLLAAGASLAIGQDGTPKATNPTTIPESHNSAPAEFAKTTKAANSGAIADEKSQPAASKAATTVSKSASPIQRGGMGMAGYGGMGMGMMPGMGGGMGGMGGRGGMGGQGFASPVQISRIAALLITFGDDPESGPILEALDQNFTLKSTDTSTLASLLDQIRSEATTPDGKPIPIFVNPAGLQEVGVELSTNVAIDLPGVPLKTSLRLLLKGLGLAYCVRDGVLIISSLSDIQQELLEEQNELVGRNPDQYEIGPDGVIQTIKPKVPNNGGGGFN